MGRPAMRSVRLAAAVLAGLLTTAAQSADVPELLGVRVPGRTTNGVIALPSMVAAMAWLRPPAWSAARSTVSDAAVGSSENSRATSTSSARAILIAAETEGVLLPRSTLDR